MLTAKSIVVRNCRRLLHFGPMATLYESRTRVSEYSKDNSESGGSLCCTIITRQNIREISSVFDSIPLASRGGDSSDLGHYCAKIIPLGLCDLGTNRRLSARIPVIRRGGIRTRRFLQTLRERSVSPSWDQLPNPIGSAPFVQHGPHLSVGTSQPLLPDSCKPLAFAPSSFEPCFTAQSHWPAASGQQKLFGSISE